MRILSGRPPADKILKQITDELNQIMQSPNARAPMFAIIQIGDNAASNIYIANKKRVAEQIGFDIVHHKFADGTNQEHIKSVIHALNSDNLIDGIIMQLPVAGQYKHLLYEIAAQKDIDGLGAQQQSNLTLDKPGLRPCTPLGVIKMMEYYNIDFVQDICIVGRSILVGQSLALMLMHKHGTVTIVHHKTRDIKKHLAQADIVCLAAGCPGLVDSSMLKENAVIIDIAITSVEGKVMGDYSPDGYKNKCDISYSPVPGGVGPMTIACLMHNVFAAYKKSLFFNCWSITPQDR